MGWFKASGDEECACCGHLAVEDDELYYDKRKGKTMCLPCADDMSDLLTGLCDATDPRYSDDTSLGGEDPNAIARFIQFETLPKD